MYGRGGPKHLEAGEVGLKVEFWCDGCSRNTRPRSPVMYRGMSVHLCYVTLDAKP